MTNQSSLRRTRVVTDTCMFIFDVLFDKTHGFISVRVDSVYICRLKFKLVDTKLRYTFNNLSRTFDVLCRSEPVNLYLTSLYSVE